MNNKIIKKDFRVTREFTLPLSGITVLCYSSVLLGEVSEIAEKVKGFDNNIEIVLKVIKGWNLYLNEADEKPAEINLENLKQIPAPDFEYLVKELELFSAEQKKS